MQEGMTKSSSDFEEQNVVHRHENEGAASEAYKEPTALSMVAK